MHARMERILDAADELGMVAIVGFFYFGQEPRMNGEAAVIRACDAATDWLLEQGYTNVLVEIANECDIIYKHDIIKPPRSHELIERVQQRSRGKVSNPAGRLLVSTSYCGGSIPRPDVAQSADFLLIHGNGVGEPAAFAQMVRRDAGRLPGYHGQPILFNEDDHFDFDKPHNNMLAAVGEYASWGYFDYRMEGEGYERGVPERAGGLGDQLGAQARVLRAGEAGDGGVRGHRLGTEFAMKLDKPVQ